MDIQAPMNFFPNFVSLKDDVETSNTLVNCMISITSYQVDIETRKQILIHLGTVIEKLCYRNQKFKNKYEIIK